MINRLVSNAPSVREALKHEPAIRPSFRHANISTIITVIYCLVWDNVTDAASIYRYLEGRECRFSRDVIDYILHVHEGDDPDRHLWARDSLGAYEPLIDGGWAPGAERGGLPDDYDPEAAEPEHPEGARHALHANPG